MTESRTQNEKTMETMQINRESASLIAAALRIYVNELHKSKDVVLRKGGDAEGYSLEIGAAELLLERFLLIARKGNEGDAGHDT